MFFASPEKLYKLMELLTFCAKVTILRLYLFNKQQQLNV